MRFDIILPDSVLEMGVSTNLNCSPVEGQVFGGPIVTHKFSEAIGHIHYIHTFKMIGCIEATLVAIDLAGDISPKGLTLRPNCLLARYLLLIGNRADLVPLWVVAFKVCLALSRPIPNLSDNNSADIFTCVSVDV